MNNHNEVEEKRNIQEKILEIENLAKKFMSAEAISRYGTLKSAHPEKALQSIAFIAQLGSENKIKERVSDQQYKELLMKLEPEKKETKITWK